MPLQRCQENKKPGWKWGNSGKCYTYTEGDKASEKRARDRASKQGQAQAFSKARERGAKKPTGRDFD